MSRPIETPRAKQRGFMTIMYALMIFGIVAFAGLAVDVGYMQVARRQAHAAADASAMGALRELELGNISNVVFAGKNDASLNGFTDGQNRTTVSINNPPLYGTYRGDPTAVEAIITRTVPSFFMMIFGQNGTPVTARSVGRTTTTEGSIGGCIFALDQNAKSAFSINGTSINLNTSCSAIVDSSDNQAFTMGSSVTYYLSNHAHVGVKGDWSLNGQASLIDTTTNAPENPNHNGVFSDPLARVVAPTASGLTIQSTSSVS